MKSKKIGAREFWNTDIFRRADEIMERVKRENLSHEQLIRKYAIETAQAEFVIASKPFLKAEPLAKKRRVLGEERRLRVCIYAQDFMHLSREKAAPLVGKLIGMSEGRVQRLLSEIYPGDSWRRV